MHNRRSCAGKKGNLRTHLLNMLHQHLSEEEVGVASHANAKQAHANACDYKQLV